MKKKFSKKGQEHIEKLDRKRRPREDYGIPLGPREDYGILSITLYASFGNRKIYICFIYINIIFFFNPFFCDTLFTEMMFLKFLFCIFWSSLSHIFFVLSRQDFHWLKDKRISFRTLSSQHLFSFTRSICLYPHWYYYNLVIGFHFELLAKHRDYWSLHYVLLRVFCFFFSEFLSPDWFLKENIIFIKKQI